jgi:hypothetical protein
MINEIGSHIIVQFKNSSIIYDDKFNKLGEIGPHTVIKFTKEVKIIGI